MFAGYESNPEANAEAFVGRLVPDRRRGPCSTTTATCSSRGARKEIINRGGEKVAPAEVEDALLGHPDVVQAVSFAVPDERLGEDVGAAVVLREGSQRDGARATGARGRAARRLQGADASSSSSTTCRRGRRARSSGSVWRSGSGSSVTCRSRRGRRTSPPRTAFERELAELWADDARRGTGRSRRRLLLARRRLDSRCRAARRDRRAARARAAADDAHVGADARGVHGDARERELGRRIAHRPGPGQRQPPAALRDARALATRRSTSQC